MKSIFTVLQDFERLIYHVLMWIVLIPKTIVKIVINPTWAHDYIRGELKQEGSPPFDEYMSPVILLLVVALLPALVFNSLPRYNTVITSSAEEKPTTDRILSFEAQTIFLSSSPDMEFFHLWTVERINADGSYDLVSGETHQPGDAVNYTEKVDNRTVKDRFIFTFPEGGEYFVNVYSGKYGLSNGQKRIIESHSAYIKVIVPLKTDEQVVISNDASKSAAEATVVQSSNITDQIQKEKTIFLALALMLPPLLFALAIKLFTKDDIGELTLKDHFYVQCYFFSPLSLAIWATYYAYYFYTTDALFYLGNVGALRILTLPTILAMIWFFRTEMKTIAYERNTNPVKSFLIVTLCIAILGIAAYVIFFFQTVQDSARLFIIKVYPLAATGLILSFVVSWFRRRRTEGKTITVKNLSWVFVSFLFVGLVWIFISRNTSSSANELASIESQIVGLSAAQGTQVADAPIDLFPSTVEMGEGTSTPILEAAPSSTATPTMELILSTSTLQSNVPVAVEATPTPELVLVVPTPAPQPYYTEDFNSDLPDWIRFMTYGDSRMVKESIGLGKLSISLDPFDDKFTWYYLVNPAFTYSNVKVSAVVTNQGNNANGISLICRYSDIGWYEFVVSSSGVYSILAVDNQGIVNQGYNQIATGGSEFIKTGFQTNEYTAVCNGNQLSLIINQKVERTITDARFQFAEGKIGLAVSSPEKLPVNIAFESLTVSEP